MRLSHISGLALSSLIIASCQAMSPEPEKVRPAGTAYLCGDVEAILGQVETETTLFLPDAEIRLTPVVSDEPGAKYFGEEDGKRVGFWERGDRATLWVGATEYPECSRLF